MVYFSGNDVQQDLELAIKLFREAAKRGDAVAQDRLGFCYAFGRGVTKGTAEAFRWFQKAGKQGITFSLFMAGKSCYEGIGLPKDDTQAYKWFNLAAAVGDDAAVKQRDQLSRQMTAGQIADAQRLTREFIAGTP